MANELHEKYCRNFKKVRVIRAHALMNSQVSLHYIN